MRYLLVGNFGVRNAGDEILRRYFLSRYPEHEWLVCSANPAEGELPRFPAGVRSLFSLRWKVTLQALRQCDGLVFGGGSLFTDAESMRACIVWFIHALAAFLLHKPVFLAFQGIGPFRLSFSEFLARIVVKRARFLSVRDEASMKRVDLWKKNTECIHTFDPSITLLEGKNCDLRTNNVYILIPRFSTGWTMEIRENFSRCIEHFLEGGSVRILSLQPGDKQERALCHDLASTFGIPIYEVDPLEQSSVYLEDATCVVSERYHGLLAALASGVPFLALFRESGDKLETFANACGCPAVRLSAFRHTQVTKEDWKAHRSRMATLQWRYRELALRGEDTLRQALLGKV